MKNFINVLLTGVGSPAAPGVVKSLRSVKDHDIRLVGIDMNAGAVGAAMVDQFYQGFGATDPDFLPFLQKLCKKEKIDVVLPLVSAELYLLATLKREFRRSGTEISVSDPEPLLKAIHKGALFQHLQKSGIPVPKYKVVQTKKQLKQAIAELGYPANPVCFKPVYGDGSRGFRILDIQTDRSRQLFYEKPNSTYLSYRELIDVLKSTTTIPELLVMEYLPHEEYSVDILARQGNVLIAIPREREMTVGGISVKGTIVREQDVMEYCRTIVQELQLHGNIGIQVRRDVNGQPKILEINPRIQGTIVHCTAAGVNLPFLAVKLAKQWPICDEEFSVSWGTKMIRYWEELFYSQNGTVFKLPTHF